MIGYIIHRHPTFDKDLDRLARKFPKIRSDIQESFNSVQSGSNIGPCIA